MNAPPTFLRSRISTDERGAVAPIAAVLMIAVTIAAFTALDFHHVTVVRGQLQDALDATTIAVSRSNLKTAAARKKMGQQLLQASLSGLSASAELDSVNFKEMADGTLVGTAKLSFSPAVKGLVTKEDVVVAARSEIHAGDDLEVALVLDNTYSMEGTRLATLKTAATSFVDKLEKAASMRSDPNALKISLVPFSTTVNVGSTYSGQTWMDLNGASPAHGEIFNSWANRFTLFGKIGVKWKGCVEGRPPPYDVLDDAPTTAKPETLFVPYFAPDEPDSWTFGWTNDYLPDDTASTEWKVRQGGVAKYDQVAPAPVSLGSGYNTGPNYGCELQPLVRLTTDGDKVKQAIAAMTVTGDTIIPMGLIWGWHTLSPNAPFKDGSAYGGEGKRKIVVLMTDGQNASFNGGSPNESIYAGIGYLWQNRIGIKTGSATQRRDALDARLSLLCTNMKAKGIVIYTVRVEVDEGSADVLRNCASAPANFHDVKSASELGKAFDAIAGAINQLRIAH